MNHIEGHEDADLHNVDGSHRTVPKLAATAQPAHDRIVGKHKYAHRLEARAARRAREGAVARRTRSWAANAAEPARNVVGFVAIMGLIVVSGWFAMVMLAGMEVATSLPEPVRVVIALGTGAGVFTGVCVFVLWVWEKTS